MRVSNLFTASALLILISSCSENGLLIQSDYSSSMREFYQGSYEEALEHFPAGEQGGFITTMEKAYLSLLNGKPEIDKLIEFSNLLDERIRYRASRELKSFFYMASPEGYYASEHEVIWLHMLLSWGYSQRGEQEKGCVEARRASHLLTAPWSEEGHFDDPTLRVILAGLWSLCGSWEDARVDFRVAWELDRSLAWALELADRTIPPKNLVLILGGVGPDPYWDPHQQINLLRGLRNLGFRPQGRRSKLKWADSNLQLHLTPGSLPWYERHFIRDNAIQELIEDSHYGGKAVYEGGKGAAQSWVSASRA